MIKKFLVKLVNYGGTRENNPKTIHDSIERAGENSKLAEERHRIIMEGRGNNKYRSEVTPPTDDEVTGPSDSEKVPM